MNQLPKQFIDDVRHDADIIDIIGRSVQLKKAGRDYTALCPFHNEKSPSFTVSPVKQFYHCFGCGAHGDAINWMVEFNGMTFLEAVERLAGEQGKRMPERQAPTAEVLAKKRHDEEVLSVLATAKNVFFQNLRIHPQAVEYYKSRGLAKETVVKFGLGYADSGISEHLPSVGTEVLVEAGLLVVNEQTGETYDKFRRRVIFPIHSEKGDVIGFGGRVLNDGDLPKYMNSPESCVFSKGAELYGLYFARPEIRRTRTALVVEGYMDVVALHQCGDARAVAALGTSMTVQQATRLFRMCDEIVFCFDGDKAGMAAADRAARIVLSVLPDGKAARFVTLPEEHDPDSFVLAHGLEKWHAYLAEYGVPLSRKITAIVTGGRDISLPEDKTAIAVDCEEVLASIQHAPKFGAALKAHFEQMLGMRLKFSTTRVSQPDAVRDISAEENTEKVIAPQANRLLFYQNYALLCSFDPELAHEVPDDMLDKFAALISGWFSVAPAELPQRAEMAKVIKHLPLRMLIRDTLARLSDRMNNLQPAALEQEKQAVLQAITRDAERSRRAEQAAALFG